MAVGMDSSWFNGDLLVIQWWINGGLMGFNGGLWIDVDLMVI